VTGWTHPKRTASKLAVKSVGDEPPQVKKNPVPSGRERRGKSGSGKEKRTLKRRCRCRAGRRRAGAGGCCVLETGASKGWYLKGHCGGEQRPVEKNRRKWDEL